jgi:ornithine cyclodeaminase
MKIYNLDQIKKRISISQIIKRQEEGFVLYSKGLTNIPLPGYLKHTNPEGSYHIKYGHIPGDSFWVVKIAGGPHHLPINGMMLAISTTSGQTEYLLQDEGYLTSLRTAVAGIITAKYLANKDVKAIGVIGTGVQARMQVELLSNITDCKTVYAWGRSDDKLNLYKDEMSQKGFDVSITHDVSLIAEKCNLIITATASESAILKASYIRPGTHITAIGADSPGKSELDPELIAKSDIVVVDSKSQCLDHGEAANAYKKGLIKGNDLIELGAVIDNPSLGQINSTQITVADLTGLAVQDIQIVKSIIDFSEYEENND